MQISRLTNSLSNISSMILVMVLCILFDRFDRFPVLAAKNENYRYVTQLSFYNFQKIRQYFNATLVEVDERYPANTKRHLQFEKLAEELRFNRDILVAHYILPYHDDNDDDANESRAFIKKLNLNVTNDPPVVLLFSGAGPIYELARFEDEANDAASMRKFLRIKLPKMISLRLPGCIEKLDLIADNFVRTTDKYERKILLTRCHSMMLEFSEKSPIKEDRTELVKSAKIYCKLMERLEERGDIFIESETERLRNILRGKQSDAIRIDLQNRLYILETFQSSLELRTNRTVAETVVIEDDYRGGIKSDL
ncbi:Endoplasmic reticulum resident protein 29 [Sarcoptes scabiei]|uniref:Endoplasmic reticulum resident protein 29 n=1 Tax=Sarcoptes scabiei TaxID=52283 RepID=A0A834VAI3_SARSC|nr:Endoplasmic reticulum resident protein 29 [Sarcoptes scabiei]